MDRVQLEQCVIVERKRESQSKGCEEVILMRDPLSLSGESSVKLNSVLVRKKVEPKLTFSGWDGAVA